MLLLKPGVRVTGLKPELLLAIVAAERAYAEAGVDLVLTACVDGNHSVGSFHYSGMAVDLRTHTVTSENLTKLVTRIKGALGTDYDVINEGDHLHIEFQPKVSLRGQ